MAERITDKLVRGLVKPAKGNAIIYDADKGKQKGVAGFGIRITANGAKSFILNYRNADGRDRRITIGTYGPHEWSVEAARKRAGALKKKVSLGEDPLADRVKLRTDPTVKDMCERHIEEYLPRKRPSSQRGDRQMMKRFIIPKLGPRKVASVKHADIDALHRSLKSTPYQANRTCALLSKMFSLAVRRGWCETNPCQGLERFPEENRTRHLTPEEIGRLTTALAACDDQRAANVVRLCLLTGCRVGEALGAKWDELDLDEGVWTKDAATTKQKTMHTAPLSEAAVILLKGIRADAPDSPWVFPGKVRGAHRVDIKGPWQDLRKAAGIEGVRLHDLRHTHASLLAAAGASLPMIGAILGHVKAETTMRYVHFFNDPLRKLTDEVGHVVNGTKPAEVVPIRKDGVA